MVEAVIGDETSPHLGKQSAGVGTCVRCAVVLAEIGCVVDEDIAHLSAADVGDPHLLTPVQHHGAALSRRYHQRIAFFVQNHGSQSTPPRTRPSIELHPVSDHDTVHSTSHTLSVFG